jgi:hypothetical protein
VHWPVSVDDAQLIRQRRKTKISRSEAPLPFIVHYQPLPLEPSQVFIYQARRRP